MTVQATYQAAIAAGTLRSDPAQLAVLPELERIRAQVIAGLVYQRDSITSQATAIGSLETVGLSWKLMDSELADLQSVTPEDIQKAARTYFTRERLSVAHVLPEETAHE